MRVTSRALATFQPHLSFDYSELIDAIGEPDFSSKFTRYLYDTCGAEHCAILRISAEQVNDVAAVSIDGSNIARRQTARYVGEQLWRRDPAVDDARRSHSMLPVLIRFDPRQLQDRLLRDEIYGIVDIRERVLLCGRRADAVYGVSLLRSHKAGAFSEREVANLRRMGASLLSLSAKHCRQIYILDHQKSALSSIAIIEQRLQRGGLSLSPREQQVVARILFGMTTDGIALDLGIKKESVITYRKRSYIRLNIATRHELMRTYLQTR